MKTISRDICHFEGSSALKRYGNAPAKQKCTANHVLHVYGEFMCAYHMDKEEKKK